MATTVTPKLAFYLDIRVERDGHYWHLFCVPTYFNEANDGRLQNCSRTNGLLLENFRTWSQGTNDDRTTLYGWEALYYKPFFVNLSDATGMHAVLTKVDRYLQRAAEEDGWPHSYGQFCLRVCRALGASGFVRPDLFPGSKRGEYQILSPKTGMDWIDHLVYLWQQGQDDELKKVA